jgi:GxxExxY protein
MSEINLSFDGRKALSFTYGVIKLYSAFRADFVVEEKVILELKLVEKILSFHEKQLLSYLKIAQYKLALLNNFNPELLKDDIYCVVNNV